MGVADTVSEMNGQQATAKNRSTFRVFIRPPEVWRSSTKRTKAESGSVYNELMFYRCTRQELTVKHGDGPDVWLCPRPHRFLQVKTSWYGQIYNCRNYYDVIRDAIR